MGRSKGKRSNTRSSFSRAFKKHGPEHSSTYIRSFKLGEYVDIYANSSIQRGLPFKFYHGKTGQIFSITKFSAGVKIEKKVGNRKITKRIYVRLEHLIKSKSKLGFFEKIKTKDKIRQATSSNYLKAVNFRNLTLNRGQGHFVNFKKIITVDPEPYSIVV